MRQRLKQHVTYANVMATVAVFVALGGTGYAAVKIDGKSIRDHSIAGKKLKKGAKVPRAARADRLGTLTPRGTLQHCYRDTVSSANTCVEKRSRPAESFASAVSTCDGADRRLVSWQELYRTVSRPEIALDPGGELTDEQVGQLGDGTPVMSVLLSESGTSGSTPANFDGKRAFRCAADPTDNDVLDPR